MHFKLNTDIVIIGAGIAGLWTFNQLLQNGFKVLLLESNALGSFQTIHSQGIIHGGLKYALTGKLSHASQTIANMPEYWQACLEGEGLINLKKTKILSKEQHLFSTGQLKSNLINFFASKMLCSRVEKLTSQQYPEALKHPDFKGQVYALKETILDIPSLIENLSKPYLNQIIHIKPTLDFIRKQDCHNLLIETLKVTTENKILLEISAKKYVFTAGENNVVLHPSLSPPEMQIRPLHMVSVTFKTPTPRLFAHCMEGTENPRLTISTHQTTSNQTVWYCGGDLAETGVKRTQKEQIAFAKGELKTIFPWIDFSQTDWHSFFINRAEGKQPKGKRPANAVIQNQGNTIVAWPTKLVLAPVVSENILAQLKAEHIMPLEQATPLDTPFPSPAIAKPHWECEAPYA